MCFLRSPLDWSLRRPSLTHVRRIRSEPIWEVGGFFKRWFRKRVTMFLQFRLLVGCWLLFLFFLFLLFLLFFFLHSPADVKNFSHSPSDEGCNSAAIFYWSLNVSKQKAKNRRQVGLSPFPVIVTTRILAFLVGDSYKPSSSTSVEMEGNPNCRDMYILWVVAQDHIFNIEPLLDVFLDTAKSHPPNIPSIDLPWLTSRTCQSLITCALGSCVARPVFFVWISNDSGWSWDNKGCEENKDVAQGTKVSVIFFI